jgi:predicted TIM-barrel fold metal-dependent hydrolase
MGFQSSLASLITEGVFVKFPKLKVVLLESGVPGCHPSCGGGEVLEGRCALTWLDRPPSEYVRDHVRLSIRPLDVPEEADTMARLMDHLGSDELLLWSSDWPHAHFEGRRDRAAGA